MSSRAHQQLLPLVETLAVTLLAIGLPFVFSSDDRLMLESGMYWPMFGAILVALRYGFWFGFFSVLLLVISHYLMLTQGLVVYAFVPPYETFAGAILLTMLVGEFGDSWRRRDLRQQTQVEVMHDKLESFTDSYYILQNSLYEMEKKLAGYSMSLAEALESIRNVIEADETKVVEGKQGLAEAKTSAQNILNIFAEHGGIQAAAIVAGDDLELPGVANGELLASVGSLSLLNLKDPLVLASLEQKKLCSINENHQDFDSRYQACVPVTGNRGEIYYLIVVEAFHFYAFKKNNLVLLSVISSFLGNCCRRINQRRQALQNGIEYHVDSKFEDQYRDGHVIEFCMQKETVSTKSLFDYLISNAKNYDVEIIHKESLPRLVLFLPITDVRGVDVLLERLEMWCFLRLKKSLSQIGVTVNVERNQAEVSSALQATSV